MRRQRTYYALCQQRSIFFVRVSLIKHLYLPLPPKAFFKRLADCACKVSRKALTKAAAAIFRRA